MLGRNKRSYTSSEFPGIARGRGMGRISRSGGSTSLLNKAKISDSVRNHRAGAASNSMTVGKAHHPHRRLLGNIDQRLLARVLTIVAAVAVVGLGISLIVTAATSGGKQIGDLSPIDVVDGENIITPDDTGATVTIALGGSIKLQQEVIEASATGEGYDFNNYLSELKSIMTADLSIVSLSGTIDGYGSNENVSGYPSPNYPAQLVDSLANIGVNHAAAASGYTLKNGYDAMSRTVDVLEDNGITSLGVTNNPDTGNTVCVKRINSVAIGIGAYNCVSADELESLKKAQSTAGFSGDQLAYCVNQLDIANAAETIIADVNAMRAAGAKFVIICINWGSADLTSPDYDMRNLAQEMIDNGVDVTLGYGSDVMQKITVKEHTDSEGKKKKCYVFYSLGNLFADCDSGATQKKQESLVINLTLERAAGSEEVAVSAAQYHPVYVNRDENYVTENTYLKYRAVPAARYVDAEELPDVFSTRAQWDKCKQTFTDVRTNIQESWNVEKHFVLGSVEKVDSVTDGSAGENASL